MYQFIQGKFLEWKLQGKSWGIHILVSKYDEKMHSPSSNQSKWEKARQRKYVFYKLNSCKVGSIPQQTKFRLWLIFWNHAVLSFPQIQSWLPYSLKCWRLWSCATPLRAAVSTLSKSFRWGFKPNPNNCRRLQILAVRRWFDSNVEILNRCCLSFCIRPSSCNVWRNQGLNRSPGYASVNWNDTLLPAVYWLYHTFRRSLADKKHIAAYVNGETFIQKTLMTKTLSLQQPRWCLNRRLKMWNYFSIRSCSLENALKKACFLFVSISAICSSALLSKMGWLSGDPISGVFSRRACRLCCTLHHVLQL